MAFKRSPSRQPPYLITAAQQSRGDQISDRQRRYLIMMGIRVACLLLSIFLLRGAARWVALGISVLLPWVAVTAANAAGAAQGRQQAPAFYTHTPPERTAIDPGPRDIEG